jgi:hypothetical protein
MPIFSKKSIYLKFSSIKKNIFGWLKKLVENEKAVMLIELIARLLFKHCLDDFIDWIFR